MHFPVSLIAISDTVLIQIIGPVIAFFGLMFQGVMAYLMARLNQQQGIRAREAAERDHAVKRALQISTAKHVRHLNFQDQKLEDIGATTRSTHQMVYSNGATETLRLNREVTRKLANITKDPEDIRVADTAEMNYTQHVLEQSQIEGSAPGTDPHLENPGSHPEIGGMAGP